MNAEKETKLAAKPTGRRFGSVAELMRVEGVSNEVQEKYREIADSTRVVMQLAMLRQKAGLTQEDMAQHLGVSQSAISKLESGSDDSLTLGEIKGYAQATGERFGVMFGKPYTHVEAIKGHALSMKHHLTQLTQLARKGEELEKEIQGFFGEAFFNVLSILAECQNDMPNPEKIEVRMEILGAPYQNQEPPKRLRRTAALVH
jgi:transcriptional regulator with XRE-family HTH domain